jgi:hypothetical protein
MAHVRAQIRSNGSLLFGADANTPLIDECDFANTRTHWYTGNKRLNGEPGDDLLCGADKVHGLDDALRHWLALHPEEMDRIRASRTVRTPCHQPPHWNAQELAGHGTALRFSALHPHIVNQQSFRVLR